MNISERIDEALKDKRITRANLAEGIGMPQSTLSTKMKNDTFTAKEMIEVLKFLSLTANEFLDAVEEKTLVTFGDKSKFIPSTRSNTLAENSICSMQLKDEDGNGIYIMAADQGYLFCIEDMSIRPELVIRSRAIEKVYQFTTIGGFDIVETDDITMSDLIERLLKKRGKPTDNIRGYIKDMKLRWLNELKSYE